MCDGVQAAAPACSYTSPVTSPPCCRS